MIQIHNVFMRLVNKAVPTGKPSSRLAGNSISSYADYSICDDEILVEKETFREIK